MAFQNYRKLIMVGDSFYIPKHNPSKPQGEDAHFFLPAEQVIGVADGVGGWARKGIDAGEYARELMKHAVEAVCEVGPYSVVNPKEILQTAFFDTVAEGSSTACIITLAGDTLRAANLGDSGFLVIRKGKTVYRSPVQQHCFNCPYQMGNSTRTEDSPDKAEEIEVEVEAGDVVIAGTDGLFDNMFPDDIEAVVGLCLAEMCSPETMAWTLARVAQHKSLEIKVPSPFQLAAREAGVSHVGGKYDDITVVVAYISPNNRLGY